MPSSVTDVVLSPTVPSVYFLTIEDWYKALVKDLSEFDMGEGAAYLHYTCVLSDMRVILLVPCVHGRYVVVCRCEAIKQ